MKKIILSLCLIAVIAEINAQICVPGTLTSPKNAYIIPDSATNFANACPGTYYEQILYIKAAKDTAIAVTTPISGVITAKIDSFVVDANIVGLPSYLSVQSVPAPLGAAGPSLPKSNYTRLVIPGDSLACVKISGNVPASEPAATLPLTINLRVYVDSMHSTNLALELGIPTIYPGRKTDTVTDIKDYRIIVFPTPCWPTSINTLSQYQFSLFDNVPNPSKEQTRISFESKINGKYVIKLLNPLGEMLMMKHIDAFAGVNYVSVETAQLPAGIYLYSLSDGINEITKRMEVIK